MQRLMVKPISVAEKQLAIESKARRIETQATKDAADKAAAQAILNAAKAAQQAATDTDKQQEADAAMKAATDFAVMAEQLEVPPVPRLIADDITPEAVASLLAEQGGRLAIISSEGGIFDIIAGRYSKSIPNHGRVPQGTLR